MNSENVSRYVELIASLKELEHAGRADEPEGDAVYNRLDALWQRLTTSEQEYVELHAGDLADRVLEIGRPLPRGEGGSTSISIGAIFDDFSNFDFHYESACVTGDDGAADQAEAA